MTRSAAVGAVRLRNTLPSRQVSSSSPTDDEKRHRKFLQVRFHVPQRRALACSIAMVSAWPCAECSASMRDEFRIAARILVFLRLARRPYRHRSPPPSAMPFSVNIFAVSAACARIACARGRIGQRAPAATGRGHRDATLRMAHADMQRGIGAHRMADHMRFLDAERIHDARSRRRARCLGRSVPGRRNIGRRIAALAIGDAAMRAREAAHLRLPGAVVAGEFMHENDGRAGAGLFVIETDAVRGFDLGHDFTRRAWPPRLPDMTHAT